MSAPSTPRSGGEPPTARVGDEPPSTGDNNALPYLDADNPLLARVQEQLRAQLVEANRRVKYDLLEKEEELRQTQRRREELGVELYGVQQQLAKLQQSSEDALQRYATMKALRDEAEALLNQHRAEYSANTEALQGLAGELRSFQSQSDTVNATLAEVDLFNDELRAQIAVTRRATYKAEEDIKAMERNKTRQDLQIDKLNEQIQRLHDEEALYETQLVSQAEETAAALATLSEASAEIADIQKDKQQLVSKWKSALGMLQRRDETLQAAQAEATAVREQYTAMEAELANLKKAIRAESEANERLSAVRRKTESEARYLEAQLAQVQAERDKMHETLSVMQASMAQTEAELLVVNNERSRLANSTKGLQREADQILLKQREYEEAVDASNTEKITLEKGTSATAREVKRVRERAREVEQEQIKQENELERIRMDTLNVRNHNEKLAETLSGIVAEMQALEKLIDAYDVEIRRRNDEIQKKQAEVDRLNKVLDQLKAGMADENTGPLEATVHNLTKAIAAQTQSATDLQNYWLRAQRELVQSEKDVEEQSVRATELRAQLAVLRQKKLRLDAKAVAQQRECAEYEAHTRAHQFELRRLNEAIAANVDAQQALAEANLSQENDFVKRLQDAEAEMVRLELAIDETVAERKYLLSDVIEAERQIMLWEKKIQLAKETQSALDPEVGTTEVRVMQKEIHRMRLRLASLLKKQERMMLDMEKAVARREHIWTKGRAAQMRAYAPSAGSPRAAAAAAAAKGVQTQASLQRAVTSLNKQIKAATDDLTASGAELERLTAAQRALVGEIESAQARCETLEGRRAEAEAAVERLAWQRETAVLAVSRGQRIGKAVAAEAAGTYKAAATPETIDAVLAAQRERAGRIRDALLSAAAQHPKQAPVLEALAERVAWGAAAASAASAAASATAVAM